MTTVNPLRVDPTRTTTIRNNFLAEVGRRFRQLRGHINRLVIEEDAFGLANPRPQLRAVLANAYPTTNTRWQFHTDPQKVAAFRTWLKDRVDADILGADNTAEPWTNKYIESAYRKGRVRAYLDAKAQEGAAGGDNLPLTGEQFLRGAFDQPETTRKLELVFTRSYGQLQGITGAMDQELSTVLADGLAHGKGPYDIAREMNQKVSGIEKKRGRTIARTEVIHAHAEAQLDTFEDLGIDELDVMAEWNTAGDSTVCPLCRPLNGAILTVKEARGILPRHPNCRCMWIPAGVGEPTVGQKWNKQIIDDQFLQSMKQETGQKAGSDARDASRWLGADKKLVNKGHKKPTKKSLLKKAQGAITQPDPLEVAQANVAGLQAAEPLSVLVDGVPVSKPAVDIAGHVAPMSTDVTGGTIAELSDQWDEAFKLGLVEQAEHKAGHFYLTQDRVVPDTVLGLLGKDLDAVRAVRMPDGKLVLLDGHHRVTAAWAQGKAIKVDIFDYAKLAEAKVAKAAAEKAAKEAAEAAAKAKALHQAKTKAGVAKAKLKKDMGFLESDFHLPDGADVISMTPEASTQYMALKYPHHTIDEIQMVDTGQLALLKNAPVHEQIEGFDALAAKLAKVKDGDTIEDLLEIYPELTVGQLALAEDGTHKLTLEAIDTMVAEELSHLPPQFATLSGDAVGELLNAPDLPTGANKAIELFDAQKKAAKEFVQAKIEQEAKEAAAKALAEEAAAKAAHSHKVKLGMAKKHYAKDKFSGGVGPHDFTDTGDKLALTGINKVLHEKGWSSTTVDPDVLADVLAADDLVAQKQILDGIKKAPKGTPLPPATPATLPPPPGGGDPYALLDDSFDLAFDESSGKLDPVFVKGHLKAVGATDEQIDDVLALQYWKQQENAINAVKTEAKANAAKAAPTPSVAPPTPAPTPAGALPNPATLKHKKDLPGSTRPKLVEDTTTGQQWVMKANLDPGHVRSEALADELYRRAGFAVPKGGIVEAADGPIKFTEFLEGGQTLDQWLSGATAAQKKAMFKELGDGFVMDSLLANHDVAGLSMDNIFIVKGKPYRIDNGGALLYRAQGMRKADFGPVVQELKSMRDPGINANTAAIYGHLTDDDIHGQIRDVLARRDLLLGAIDDADLRRQVAARMDYLEGLLPAPKTATRKATAVTGVRAPEYGIGPDTAERVKRSRINGVTIAGDRDDIEDMGMLAWQEVDSAGKQVTKVQLKVTKNGSRKVEAALGGDFLKAKTAGGGAYTAPNVHPDDDFWQPLLSAIKTTNHHASDGAYNQGTLESAFAMRGQLEALSKSADAQTKAMADQYLSMLDDIKEATEKQTATKQWGQFVYKPEPVKPGGAATPGLRVQRQDVLKGRVNKIDKAFADETTAANMFPGQNFHVDFDDGSKVVFHPVGEDIYDRDGLALEGVLQVTIEGEVTTERLKEAQAVLRTMGLDTTPPTPEYEELVYLHRTVYLRKDHKDPKYRALFNSDMPDHAKVREIKKWAADKYDVDFDKLEKTGQYNPAGFTNTSFGDGYRHWWRWDITPDDMEKEMAGYTLTHRTGGPLNSTIDAFLNSGGEITPTTGRWRKGVKIGGVGMSPDDDVVSGGASYFYTRIRKTRDAERSGEIITFKVRNLARADAVSHRGDEYGRLSVMSQRGTVPEDYKRFSGGSTNETDFKEGLSLLDDVEHIYTYNPEELLGIFEKHGVTVLPDGRKVKDIIKTPK